jgi:hypothetical protein
MVYDVTNPANPVFVDYKNSRNLTTYGGDNGPEGIVYIPNEETTNGKAYLLLANEVSSTISVFEVQVSNLPYTRLHVDALLEGYYAGAEKMVPVKFNQGVSLDTTICDDLTIELYSAANITSNNPGPYTPDYTTIATIGTDGSMLAQFPSSLLGNNYWIAIRHRSHITTWSAAPVTIQEFTNYDFTSTANKAFGSNQTEVSTGTWALYAGDLVQDGNIDLIDLAALEVDVNNFESGYFASDINGDGNVDLLDGPIVEENINNFIFSTQP